MPHWLDKIKNNYTDENGEDMTPSRLARGTGLTKQNMTKLYKKETPIDDVSVGTLKKVAKRLNKKPGELLEEIDED
jgi:DNA-binding Xre family transcriptional regulator